MRPGMTSHSDSELGSHTKMKFKAKDKLRPDVSSALLTALGAIKCSKGEKDLLKLVAVNNLEGVQHLLAAGTSANCHDKLNRTPLHIASSRSYTDMVKLLLLHGADPNMQDILLNTPLHLAACNNNLHLIKLLIDGGADIKLLNMNKKNPVQIAHSKLRILVQRIKGCCTGTVEMVKIKKEVEEIVDLMISMWAKKEMTMWGHHRNNVDDLEMIKMSLQDPQQEQKHIDTQMNKLLSELEQFSIN